MTDDRCRWTRIDGSIRERIQAHSLVQDAGYESPCWLSDYSQTHDGYARIGIGRGMVYVHRAAYEEWVGPIPDDLELDHLCRVRHCCNPDHLEAVKHAVNAQRRSELITHCIHGHEYTPENTRLRGSKRACRECGQIQLRARRAAKRKIAGREESA